MRVGWLRILGSVVAIMMVCLLFTTVQQVFTPFEYACFPVDETMTSVEGEVGLEVSLTLWSKRQLDLIVLAFLLFATATSCAAILRIEKGEPS